MDNYKLEAAFAGAGGAALFWWVENERDRTDQIRNNKLDIRDLNNQFQGHIASGDWIRLQAPSVRDTIVGLAAATPTSQPAATVPVITSTLSRPDLSGGSNIATMQWPPRVGSYDAAGRTSAPGEMALAAHVFTFQEPRAFNQGLTLSRAPTGDGLYQIFLSAQGLALTVAELRLTLTQYQQAWRNLFSGTTTPTPPPSTPAADPHQDITRVPQIVPGSFHSPITAVAPQATTAAGPTTDATQRWAVTMSNGTIPAGTNLFSITFKQPYRYRDANGNVAPLVPLCISTEPTRYEITDVSYTGFTVRCLVPITAAVATAFPLNVIVIPGVQTV